jgi:hypothetical protein
MVGLSRLLDRWRGPRKVDARLRERLVTRRVSLEDLVEASMFGAPHLTHNRRLQNIGAAYTADFTTYLTDRYPDALILVQQFAAIGVSVGIGQADKFDIAVLGRTIRFNWNDARPLQDELYDLAEETRKWIPDLDERINLLRVIHGTVSELHAAIARENHRYRAKQKKGAKPAQDFGSDLDVIKPKIQNVRDTLLKDAQRAARVKYAAGMAVGAAILALVCGLIGLAFLHDHIRAVNGVGLLAGGVGACASVFQRMGRDSLDLNYQAVGKMLTIFGAIRPFIGAVFGLVTFCILKGGLLSFLKIPSDPADQLAFVAAFAFLAGFNERFFQDMLASASSGISVTQ